ncbi:MAG: HEAT repeat domain-containing protein [Rhodothermaceae bacterium]|nr:HEAT repeat domain-containing protein [Rhodothermaceae bacterium]
MRISLFSLFLFLCIPAQAQHGISSSESKDKADSIRALIDVTLASDLDVSLWASEELVADPIALYIDDEGRAFYSKTNRQDNSEFDIRGHQDWMIESISFRTPEDRRQFLRRELAPERSELNKNRLDDLNGDGSHDWLDLTIEKEEIFRIEDTSGDGIADRSLRIVEDFNEEHTDVAGALLYHDGELFVGVGPDMWKMQDTDGDGLMDEKTSISNGYAIHIGFGAHGMSGLTVGPDGKLYWGIGDIGFHGVDQTGKLWDYSNQGVIVRSNPDGSDFEVYAAGLRNTHEFVFDEYGNLISEDNDGDHPGEKERIVYITNGSDSGWRTNWQFGKYTDPKNNQYKVWMDEDYFKPHFTGQAAHITPPISLYHSGPAGMKYNPGTALSSRWKNHFFVAQFVGNPTRSMVHAFKLKPKGASFELDGEEIAIQGVLTSGMAFGPDGALYLADWINGWGTKEEGRIWKLDAPGSDLKAIREQVKNILASDLDELSNKQLSALLFHDDMRVRQKAQFALAKRGKKGARVFRAVVKQRNHQLARIHALWGLAQLTRQDDKYGKQILKYVGDADPEIRAQAAKMLGDVRYAPGGESLIELLEDAEARPQFFAAEALGRIRYAPAVSPIVNLLEANNDEDVYLRHAGALALSRIGDEEAIMELEDHRSKAVRLAAVVALKRLGHPGVAEFLDDGDEQIVTDAARAINDDASIEAALPALAELLESTSFTNEPLLRRSINANSRVGDAESAARLAEFARRSDVSTALRVEALDALSVWGDPSVVDRVDGTYRGPDQRSADPAVNVLVPLADNLLAADKAIAVAFLEAANTLKVASLENTMSEVLANHRSEEVRLAALNALHSVNEGEIPDVLAGAIKDDSERVRMQALSFLPDQGVSEEQKVQLLAEVLERGSIEEQQEVFQALGKLGGAAEQVLDAHVDSLASGSLSPATYLELIESIEEIGTPTLMEKVQAATSDMPAHFESLEGGDRREGARVFYQNPAGQCTRCHNAGRGGGDVGPHLGTIATQLSRQELLESLVEPSKRIAPGYGENISSMPPMSNLLTSRELRDLVAFLSELK